MKRLKIYRRILMVLVIADVIAMGIFSYMDIRNQIPDRIVTFLGTSDSILLPLPAECEESVEALAVRNAGSTVSMNAKKEGDYQVHVKLFGVVPVKKVNVRVIREMQVAPYGAPVGIYVATSGILVLDTGVVEGSDGMNYEPAKNILQSGDYILKWNETKITSIEKLQGAIQKCGAKRASLTIQRNGKTMEVSVKPVRNKKGQYHIGTWVREDTQGIGTMTYVTKDGTYGALGHGITDTDTGKLMGISKGEIYSANIIGITKGKKGKPGELEGYLTMEKKNYMGKVKKNTQLGIFGKVEKKVENLLINDFCSVGMKQSIRKGNATLRTYMDGKKMDYQIRIEEINLASKDNKGMVIRVTDKKLLERTGGIVQGMSGSPILQGGKVIGAVTHVFVEDATRGYGIFIENMLGEQE